MQKSNFTSYDSDDISLYSYREIPKRLLPNEKYVKNNKTGKKTLNKKFVKEKEKQYKKDELLGKVHAERRAHYPEIQEGLDAFVKYMKQIRVEGAEVNDETQKYVDKCLSVKVKYPKFGFEIDG